MTTDTNGCQRHYWQAGPKLESYFGVGLRCPLCKLEEERETAMANAERLQGINPEEAAYWWRVAEEVSVTLSEMGQRHRASLPQEQREALEQRMAREFLAILARG